MCVRFSSFLPGAEGRRFLKVVPFSSRAAVAVLLGEKAEVKTREGLRQRSFQGSLTRLKLVESSEGP